MEAFYHLWQRIEILQSFSSQVSPKSVMLECSYPFYFTQIVVFTNIIHIFSETALLN